MRVAALIAPQELPYEQAGLRTQIVVATIMIATAMLPACGRASRPFQPNSVYQPPEAGPACVELGCPIAYVAPPSQLGVTEALQREFDRCLAIGASPDCVRDAFAAVRKSHGLDERAPTGTVTVRKLPSETKQN